MTITGATLFTGGGGADIGMKLAGINPLWGIEYDSDIAEVARTNGIPVTVADLLTCDPSQFSPVDVLHTSSPCTSFSIAKTGASESGVDKDLAHKVARFITTLLPRVFTLENVGEYRKSESWNIIRNALYGAGYWLDISRVNFADFGVPQTRKRMIVRAIRGSFVPYLPPAQQWAGWYQAVEDLIPTFEPTKFAPWQIARLPKVLTAPFLMSAGGNTNFGEAEAGRGCLSGNGTPKAFVVDGAGNNNCTTVTWRTDEQPIYTMTASMHKRPTRASIHGRVVKLTPRALARFQTFPDSYKLPASNELACKVIGNACPVTGMQAIFSQLLGVI